MSSGRDGLREPLHRQLPQNNQTSTEADFQSFHPPVRRRDLIEQGHRNACSVMLLPITRPAKPAEDVCQRLFSSAINQCFCAASRPFWRAAVLKSRELSPAVTSAGFFLRTPGRT